MKNIVTNANSKDFTHSHNYHFLCATATLEGNIKLAIDAALKTSQKPPDSLLNVCCYQTLQHFAVIPLYAYVTFGKWGEILDYSQPQDRRPYMQSIWHYARAMAFIAKDNLIDAEIELAETEQKLYDKNIMDLSIWGINSTGTLIEIAYEVVSGELAAKKGEYTSAIEHLKKSVEIESTLSYDESSTWFYPCRQNLGAVMIEAGKYEEAEKVFRENLLEFPDNGWALFGLLRPC